MLLEARPAHRVIVTAVRALRQGRDLLLDEGHFIRPGERRSRRRNPARRRQQHVTGRAHVVERPNDRLLAADDWQAPESGLHHLVTPPFQVRPVGQNVVGQRRSLVHQRAERNDRLHLRQRVGDARAGRQIVEGVCAMHEQQLDLPRAHALDQCLHLRVGRPGRRNESRRDGGCEAQPARSGERIERLHRRHRRHAVAGPGQRAARNGHRALGFGEGAGQGDQIGQLQVASRSRRVAVYLAGQRRRQLSLHRAAETLIGNDAQQRPGH